MRPIFKQVVVLTLAGWLAACAELPALEHRLPSVALEDTADTRLGQAIEPVVDEHPGKSGVIALVDGMDAFAARLLLLDAADRSVDAQYYIWQDDLSGLLMFSALQRAAERGVRVRLLLDDHGTTGMDPLLRALDGHPNIEVRLFNPFASRRWRYLDYLHDFPRLNRRMHNKSFTVDNQATIVGGRNIGDEYFDAAEDRLFVDLDILAVGPVVRDVSRDFDRYWASDSSYPASLLIDAVQDDALADLARATEILKASAAATEYLEAVRASRFVQQVLAGNAPFEWTTTTLVSDDPAKGLGRAAEEVLLPEVLQQTAGLPDRDLRLISPYFVPGKEGVEFMRELRAKHVHVEILTNSLEATDIGAVHAGYSRRREALLEAGVRLYEMKRSHSTRMRERERGFSSSSASSLHAKTFAMDDDIVFVGSYNFDPRSAQLNTEMGFVIESEALADSIRRTFDRGMREVAYEMRLVNGELQWLEWQGDELVVHHDEPGVGWWRRLGVSFLALLPIEWLL